MDEKEVSFSSQQVFRCTEVEIEVFHTYKKYINFISKEHERKILALSFLQLQKDKVGLLGQINSGGRANIMRMVLTT